MAKVLVITTNETAEVKEVSGGDALREIVGGWLEGISCGADVIAYVNEEGKYDPSLEINTHAQIVLDILLQQIERRFNPGDYIKGNVILVGTIDENGQYDGEEHDVPNRIIELVKEIGLEVVNG